VTKLVLETRAALTPLEVLEWFYSLGFSVFDVRPVHKAKDESRKKHLYQIAIGHAAGDRSLRTIKGQLLGGFPAVLRQARVKARNHKAV